VAIALALAFLLQCLAFVDANGQTYDEGVTLAAGLRLIETGRDDVNGEHPPLAKLIAAWPVKMFAGPRLDIDAWRARRESAFGLGRDLFYSSGVPYRRLLWLGRAPIVVLAVALVALIAAFAWRLWGWRAALLALLLTAFDPTLIAHGSLIGHDLVLTLWVTAGLCSVAEWCRSRKMSWLCLAGVFAGLAAATKYSGPMFAAVMCVSLAWDALRARPVSTRSVVRASAGILIVVVAGVLVVHVMNGPAGWDAYLTGIRAQLEHQRQGHPAFFLGEISQGGWIAYFPVALLMKLPPLTLLLAGVSLWMFRRGAPWSAGGPAVLVPLAILLVSLLFARLDVGVRYALPLWPLIILAASRAATLPLPTAPVTKTLIALALVYHASAAIRVAPHDLAFFSDFVGGPSRGLRYLSDSNLDWGQDIETLGQWLARREPPRRLYLAYFGTADPRAYGVRYWPAPNSCPHSAPWVPDPEPVSGRDLLAISAMNLQGAFFGDPDAYAWVRARRPVAVLGYSIWIFDITTDPEAHAALARMYERFGPSSLAAEERALAARLRAGLR
jgi:hypothetical protein